MIDAAAAAAAAADEDDEDAAYAGVGKSNLGARSWKVGAGALCASTSRLQRWFQWGVLSAVFKFACPALPGASQKSCIYTDRLFFVTSRTSAPFSV